MPEKKVILTSVGAVTGAIIVIVAFFCGFLFPSIVIDKLHDALIVDKSQPNEESFQHWQNDNYSDAAPYYKVFTMWNLTNFDAVQSSGAKPIYQSVGPYYYRRYEQKLNYSFPDGGKKVQYLTYEPYFYQPDQSGEGLEPTTDVIYNINPTYIGIIAAAGGEFNLVQGLVAPTWAEVMDGINTAYVGVVIDQYFPSFLVINETQLVNEIETTENVTNDEAFLQFLDIWANYTQDPEDIPDFTSLMRLSVSGSPSDISVASATQLFNSSQMFSLTAADPTSYEIWFAAELGNTTAMGYIAGTFGISQAQLAMILEWRARYKPSFYLPLAAEIGVDSVADIGYQQWGVGNVTTDIKDYLYPLPFPVTPEFAYWAISQNLSATFSVDQSKQFLTGNTSLLLPQYYITFMTLLQQQNYDEIQAVWGLDQQEATLLAGYITDIITTVYVVDSLLLPAFQEGGGFITWHTVDEWLWTGEDPLLEILSPSSAACNLFTNDSSVDEAMQNNLPSTYWTGKSDLDKIVEYIDYEGEGEITVWETDQPIYGTDGTQFAPDVDKNKKLEAFVSDILRVVDLVYDKTVTLKGIDLYRYLIADYMLQPDPVFYQSITGFANMTSSYAGTPAFLSKPSFLDCDEYWVDQVEGVSPVRSRDDTYLDVEPISGLTMRTHKQLQLNIYLSNTTTLLNLFNQEATIGLFYPIVAADETSQLTDKQANDFKSQVLTPLYAFKVSFIVGLAVGGLVFASFIAATVYYVKYQKRGGQYAPLGTPDPGVSRY